MVPRLVSKIGCRATTFQTTRGLVRTRASIRERRKFHPLTSADYTTRALEDIAGCYLFHEALHKNAARYVERFSIQSIALSCIRFCRLRQHSLFRPFLVFYFRIPPLSLFALVFVAFVAYEVFCL